MKTLDEVIEYARNHAIINKNFYEELCSRYGKRTVDGGMKPSCFEKYKNYNQLAKWLEELKDYKSGNCINNCKHYESCSEYLHKESYNKALDDFVNFASDMPTVEEEDGTIRPMWLDEMAEQLKR